MITLWEYVFWKEGILNCERLLPKIKKYWEKGNLSLILAKKNNILRPTFRKLWRRVAFLPKRVETYRIMRKCKGSKIDSVFNFELNVL